MQRSTAAGFTLLELLVALAITGVLTAIAIPQYRQYRQRAYDARAQSDLRNVAIAEEAYYIDHERYLTCSDASCAGLPGIKTLSEGVRLSMSAAEDSFSGQAVHSRGSGRVYRWNSEDGGMVD